MPYVGNEPTFNFASVTKDLFSGDGSTVAFTLSKASTTNGVAVFVENVRQEPTIAYAVSGTTLTFTAAPVSSSGNNIYVLHHNATASTATHPASQDLTAVNGTFTGDITINDGTAADRKILFDGNAVDYHIGLDDSADTLNIGKGSTLGTTTAMTFDTNGIITKPLQPAFLARPSSNQNDLAESVNVDIAFGTEIYDQNGDFASSVFTAPVTGKYYLFTILYTNSLDNAAVYNETKIVTSNRTYYDTIDARGFDQDLTYYTIKIAALADMDAGDTAKVQIIIEASGDLQQDVVATTSYFGGYLAC